MCGASLLPFSIDRTPLEKLAYDNELIHLYGKVKGASSVHQAGSQSCTCIDEIAGNVDSIAQDSKVQARSSDMIAAINIRSLSKESSNGVSVSTRNGCKEFLRFADVNLAAPFTNINGIEASRHALTPRIFLHETKDRGEPMFWP
jgi:hypothetical protein